MTDAFANRLRKNLAHWKKWARRRGISCFRLYDRDIPQFPFAIDCYETVAPRAETHLHVQEIDTGWKMSDADYTAWLVAVCDAVCEVCAVPAAQLHLKRRERQRGSSQYERLEDAPAEAFVVMEAGRRFEVNFDTYLDTGLFLDHRPMRAMVADAIAARGAGSAARFTRWRRAAACSFSSHTSSRSCRCASRPPSRVTLRAAALPDRFNAAAPRDPSPRPRDGACYPPRAWSAFLRW